MPEHNPDLRIVVPPEQASGTYANVLMGWFSPHEITLDFCVTLASYWEEDGELPAAVPCLVVSRVKIPVTRIFDMLQAINGIMTQYEDRFGPIKRIGEEDL